MVDASSGSPGAGVRRLLVITYHFPPDGSVGGLRWAGYAKYLARLGWEVHVITAAEQTPGAAVPGVHVHTCRRARTLNDLYNDVARSLRSARSSGRPAAPSAAANDAPDSGSSPGLVGRIRRELAALLGFPDHGRGWVLKSAWTARRLLRRLPFDAVVTSGPPHSAHIAGMLATLGKPVLHRVDMRDPWSGLLDKEWGKRMYPALHARLLIPHLERVVLRRAAGIIANTNEFAAIARRSYPAVPVTWVPNGIDPERLPAVDAEPEPGLSIAHVGTLYAGRDLGPVLVALRDFLSAHPEARAQTRLHVAGSLSGANEVRFREQVAAGALDDVVVVHGVVPSKEALALLSRSHLALVLAQDQELQVPAKLYECVALGLPTLVIAEPGSAAASEARRIGALTCDPADTEAIVGILLRLWLHPSSRRTAPRTAIDYATLAAEMDRLLVEGRASAARAYTGGEQAARGGRA